MMKKLLFLFLAAALYLPALSQVPLTKLSLEPGREYAVKGDLSQGRLIDDLAWAWSSSVACFPETQASKFTGNHVLYTFDLPSYSEMEIRLEPADKDANLSIYAYMVGSLSESNLVPKLSRCVRCEVAHQADFKRRGQDPNDNTRVITDILASRNPYQVVIGISGADRLQEGGYTLKLKINKR